jgi:hypothetical protein
LRIGPGSAWNAGLTRIKKEKAATNIELAGPRLLAGSGYLYVTPVEEKALADVSALAIMKWSFATTDESKVVPNEFKDLAVYFHSRHHDAGRRHHG